MSIRSLIQGLRRPSSRFAAGTLLAAGLVMGVVAVPSFNYVVHETSSDAFCLTCHANDIGIEVVGTVHHDNPLGFHVRCEECHIPREFVPKLMKKASSGARDVYHTILGTIDTPEKFEAHRMAMATMTWDEMRANDSRLCRHCHDPERWDLGAQTEKARRFHAGPLSRGKTCIDCHKGIAHELPKGISEDDPIEGADPNREGIESP